MARRLALSTAILLVSATLVSAQQKGKFKANVSQSKEFPNVTISPAAESAPKVFRSVLQMELIVRDGKDDAVVVYTNGTVVSEDGLIVSVITGPGEVKSPTGGVEEAVILMLDGSSTVANLVAFDPAYGVAVFRADGLDVPPLKLSKSKAVANRRLSWHAVYQQGKNTILYTRPLRVSKAAHEVSGTKDLCEVIDPGTSALTAERSGSPLLALDGSVVGIMGRQKHWNVTPKNILPRKKLAWAVPAEVLAKLLKKSSDE